MEYVKICGLKNIEDIKLCKNKNVTAVGFIYNVPKSPRNLNSVEINKILKKIPKEIRTVLVFKPKTISEVMETIKTIETDLYQIHCSFNIRSLSNLSNDIKRKLIVALKVNSENKSLIIQDINLSDNQFFAFLLDSSEGQGIEIDYDLILEVLKKTNGTNIILAGGISLNNVERIIKILKPFGIDVSSSLESDKGIKDPNKIKKFLEKLIKIKQELVV
ncbi:MAG: phosphoribosylanthranilate isomerase [Promethearchaeota archaeon]